MTEAEFRARVYRLIAAIPAGCVVTFGQLAALCGNPRAARRAARAVAAAPEGLPCHRVVRAGGHLVPEHVFGLGVQRALLLAEGAVFRGETVDLQACIWRPGAQELPG